jgi:tetratricopeptide (TPR) repeat protein
MTADHTNSSTGENVASPTKDNSIEKQQNEASSGKEHKLKQPSVNSSEEAGDDEQQEEHQEQEEHDEDDDEEGEGQEGHEEEDGEEERMIDDGIAAFVLLEQGLEMLTAHHVSEAVSSLSDALEKALREVNQDDLHPMLLPYYLGYGKALHAQIMRLCQDIMDSPELAELRELAWEVLETARVLCTKAGVEKQWELSEIHAMLGDVLFEASETAQALEEYKKCRTVRTEIFAGRPNASIVEACLLVAGCAKMVSDDLVTARECYVQALDVARALNDADMTKDIEGLLSDLDGMTEDLNKAKTEEAVPAEQLEPEVTTTIGFAERPAASSSAEVKVLQPRSKKRTADTAPEGSSDAKEARKD